jgi:hypothetical protein
MFHSSVNPPSNNNSPKAPSLILVGAVSALQPGEHYLIAPEFNGQALVKLPGGVGRTLNPDHEKVTIPLLGR